MKGIVFTLDSIFALTIASFAISILVYLQFYSQVPLQISYSEATSTFQTLSTTNVSTIISSNSIPSQILGFSTAQNDTWLQPSGNSANDGYSYHGPAEPIVAFVYTISANTISAGPIVAYGRVYFAAGPEVYALNATTGTLSWTYSNKNNINSMLAEGGSLIIENTTNLVKLNPMNGNLVWASPSFSSYGTPTSQIIYADGSIFFGATSGSSSGTIAAIAASNGTIIGSKSLAGSPVSLSTSSGSLAVLISNSAEIQLYGISSSNITGPLWTVSAAGYSTAGPDIAMLNNHIAATVPSDLSYMVYSNGTVEGTYNSGVTSAGVAFGNGIAVYQTYNSVSAVSPSANSVLWNSAVSYYIPNPSSFTIPVIGAGTIYSLWSTNNANANVILAQNLSTGNVLWQKTMPYSTSSSYNRLALGNGRLYIALGQNLIALGPCPANSNSSILGSAASLYLNGEGSCADYMLNYVRPMYNYSVYINNMFAPSISEAKFNGVNSYISNPSQAFNLNSNRYTFTAWINTKTLSPEEQVIVSYFPYVGISVQNGYFVCWLNGYADQPVQASMSALTNQWVFVACTYTGSGSTSRTSYINGVSVYTGTDGTTGTFTGQPDIGAYPPWTAYSTYFNGLISNVQIYNISLTSTQIAQLYQEGIQGKPAFTSSLVAWYPLAGDANDYSGFFNTGFPVNVVYGNGNYLPIGLKNAYSISGSGSVYGITNITTGSSNIYNVSVVSWR